jgi:hypothetical protein
MLSVLVSSTDEDDFISITINDNVTKIKRCDPPASVQPGTKHFAAVGKERKKLYWYTEFAMIMTSKNLYAEDCMLSTGDVIAGVWGTRCNFPFLAILLCTSSSGFKECVLHKAKDFRKLYPSAVLDTMGKFDATLVHR